MGGVDAEAETAAAAADSGSSGPSTARTLTQTSSEEEECLDRASLKRRSLATVSLHTSRRWPQEEEEEGPLFASPAAGDDAPPHIPSESDASEATSDEDDAAAESRCFGASRQAPLLSNDIASSPGSSPSLPHLPPSACTPEEEAMFQGMDDELEAMEREMEEAKRRSEGMRMQARALRANGERQDIRLGRSPPDTASRPSVVPQLNLGKLGLGGTSTSPAGGGRLGSLLSKAKGQQQASSPSKKASSPKLGGKKRPPGTLATKGGSGGRGGGALFLHDLPTIAGSSEEDSSDGGGEEPLSRAALLAQGSLTARSMLSSGSTPGRITDWTSRVFAGSGSATARLGYSQQQQARSGYGVHKKPTGAGDIDDLLADLA